MLLDGDNSTTNLTGLFIWTVSKYKVLGTHFKDCVSFSYKVIISIIVSKFCY